MIYNNNTDLKKELKKILIDENLSLTKVAETMGISRQQLNNLFSKTNFSFDDMNKICNSIGYKLEINIKKAEEQSSNSKTQIKEMGKLSNSKIG